MKRVLVSGYIGFNNFGDEAIFYALKNHLKSLGFEVSALSGNRKKYDIKTYNYKKPLKILKALFSCDILISGGGSLLQNKTSSFSLFYYLFIIFLAKLLLKKVIIFAQGFEPINGIVPVLITKFILKQVDFISVRDQKSVDYLKSLNINSTLVSDPVYSLVQNLEPCEDKKGLIVQLRDFKGLKDEFLDKLAKSVSKYNKEEILVCSLQDKIDEKICLNFIEKLKNNNTEAHYISNQPVDKTIEILNQAKFVISTRLHALITAYALKTKVFAIKYDKKIQTLCDELNIPMIETDKEDDFDSKLDEFFNHNSEKTRPFRRFEWECIDNVLEN